VHTGCQRGKRSKREKLEDLGVSGRIIVKRIFKKEYGVDWIYLIIIIIIITFHIAGWKSQ